MPPAASRPVAPAPALTLALAVLAAEWLGRRALRRAVRAECARPAELQRVEALNGIRDDRAELGARSQEVPRAVLRRNERTDTRARAYEPA